MINKKILFIGRFPPPVHGAANMNEVYYYSLKEKFIVRKIKINFSDFPNQIGKLNFKKILGVPLVFFKILYDLIFFRPNLVYFEIAPKGLAFFRDSTYVFLCKLFRKKILFSIHARGIKEELKNKTKQKYYQLVFKNTKIIILSNLLYFDVKSLFSKEKTYVLSNAIKNEIPDKVAEKIIKEGKDKDIIRFLFLSNMIPSKGTLDSLEFCRILKDKRINFSCIFAGATTNDKSMEEWNEKLKNLELSKECKYVGAYNNKAKQNLLSNSDFLLFPTKYPLESQPLVILEAFMVGVPVFSYDTGAIKELINKDYLGGISYKRTPEDLVDIFIKLKSKVNRTKIRTIFKEKYTLNIAKKNLNKIILKELNG